MSDPNTNGFYISLLSEVINGKNTKIVELTSMVVISAFLISGMIILFCAISHYTIGRLTRKRACRRLALKKLPLVLTRETVTERNETIASQQRVIDEAVRTGNHDEARQLYISGEVTDLVPGANDLYEHLYGTSSTDPIFPNFQKLDKNLWIDQNTSTSHSESFSKHWRVTVLIPRGKVVILRCSETCKPKGVWEKFLKRFKPKVLVMKAYDAAKLAMGIITVTQFIGANGIGIISEELALSQPINRMGTVRIEKMHEFPVKYTLEEQGEWKSCSRLTDANHDHRYVADDSPMNSWNTDSQCNVNGKQLSVMFEYNITYSGVELLLTGTSPTTSGARGGWYLIVSVIRCNSNNSLECKPIRAPLDIHSSDDNLNFFGYSDPYDSDTPARKKRSVSISPSRLGVTVYWHSGLDNCRTGTFLGGAVWWFDRPCDINGFYCYPDDNRWDRCCEPGPTFHCTGLISYLFNTVDGNKAKIEVLKRGLTVALDVVSQTNEGVSKFAAITGDQIADLKSDGLEQAAKTNALDIRSIESAAWIRLAIHDIRYRQLVTLKIEEIHRFQQYQMKLSESNYNQEMTDSLVSSLPDIVRLAGISHDSSISAAAVVKFLRHNVVIYSFADQFKEVLMVTLPFNITVYKAFLYYQPESLITSGIYSSFQAEAMSLTIEVQEASEVSHHLIKTNGHAEMMCLVQKADCLLQSVPILEQVVYSNLTAGMVLANSGVAVEQRGRVSYILFVHKGLLGVWSLEMFSCGRTQGTDDTWLDYEAGMFAIPLDCEHETMCNMNSNGVVMTHYLPRWCGSEERRTYAGGLSGFMQYTTDLRGSTKIMGPVSGGGTIDLRALSAQQQLLRKETVLVYETLSSEFDMYAIEAVEIKEETIARLDEIEANFTSEFNSLLLGSETVLGDIDAASAVSYAALGLGLFIIVAFGIALGAMAARIGKLQHEVDLARGNMTTHLKMMFTVKMICRGETICLIDGYGCRFEIDGLSKLEIRVFRMMRVIITGSCMMYMRTKDGKENAEALMHAVGLMADKTKKVGNEDMASVTIDSSSDESDKDDKARGPPISARHMRIHTRKVSPQAPPPVESPIAETAIGDDFMKFYTYENPQDLAGTAQSRFQNGFWRA